jgi:hypothetical protein
MITAISSSLKGEKSMKARLLSNHPCIQEFATGIISKGTVVDVVWVDPINISRMVAVHGDWVLTVSLDECELVHNSR